MNSKQLELKLFRHISAGQDDHPPPDAGLHPRPRLRPFPLHLLLHPLLLLACHGTTELPRSASQACRFPLEILHQTII